MQNDETQVGDAGTEHQQGAEESGEPATPTAAQDAGPAAAEASAGEEKV